MPISQFSSSIGSFISLLPGTHGTALLKNHLMSNFLTQMQEGGASAEAIYAIEKGFDLKLTLFENEISIEVMWIVLIVAIIALSIIFAILTSRKKTK